MGVSQKIMRAHCAVIRPDHFKFASYGPAGRLLQVKLPLHIGLRKILLCFRALQNLLDELGCRLKCLTIVRDHPRRHASPGNEASETSDKGVSSHVCDQIKMHSPNSTARVQTQPHLGSPGCFSCPHIEGACKVNSRGLEWSGSLDAVVGVGVGGSHDRASLPASCRQCSSGSTSE